MPKIKPSATAATGARPKAPKKVTGPSEKFLPAPKPTKMPKDIGTLASTLIEGPYNDPNADPSVPAPDPAAAADPAAPQLDIAALQAGIQGNYDAGKGAIGTANDQLMQRLVALQTQQQTQLSALQQALAANQQTGAATLGTDLDRARFQEGGARQADLMRTLGYQNDRSFADRQASAGLINTGALGQLEQSRLGAEGDLAQLVADQASGGGGGSKSSSVPQLGRGDAADLATLQDPYGDIITGYSGNRKKLLNDFMSLINPDSTNVGPAWRKAKSKAIARIKGANPSATPKFKTFKKNVVNPTKKKAAQVHKADKVLANRGM